jgi:hypothetical protein
MRRPTKPVDHRFWADLSSGDHFLPCSNDRRCRSQANSQPRVHSQAEKKSFNQSL